MQPLAPRKFQVYPVRMNESIVKLDDGSLLIFIRQDRKLVRVRFIPAAVAYYYLEAQ